MINISKKIAIFGVGGFAREVFYCIKDLLKNNGMTAENNIVFVVKDNEVSVDFFLGCKVIQQRFFEPVEFQAVIAIGNLEIRKKIVTLLPDSTVYPIIIHPTAQVNETAIIGKGSIVMANTIVSCDVTLGAFCVADRGVNIGHDCRLGSFVHIAPLSVLSGDVSLGDLVYIGTQSAVKEGITITDETVIGMGGIVVKDITQKGVYVGNPVKKLR